MAKGRARPRQAPAPLAVNVEGYLRSTTGQGEAARLYARALEAAGAAVSTTAIEVESVDTGPSAERLPPEALGYSQPSSDAAPAANLLCVNGLELPLFVETRGVEYFRARPTAGVWAWETDLVPERMLESADLLDEIWVYSSYVQRNLAAATAVPVVTVPLPVPTPPPPAAAGPEPADAYTFLFNFSFLSTVERKNPLGLIEAFSRAFAPGEGPRLLLKSVNGSRLPAELERVRTAITRPDIQLLDGIVDADEQAALFERCDCYVSLHRSEGFGLTIAEAMIRGKPVIATGFSGNMDFMTDANSYPVAYEVVRIGSGGAVYPADGHWAEPDLDHAAACMRSVWEGPDRARALGAQARKELEERFSPQAVGDVARGRLESLAARAARAR